MDDPQKIIDKIEAELPPIPDLSVYPGRVPDAVVKQRDAAVAAREKLPMNKKKELEAAQKLQHQLRLSKFVEEFVSNGGNATKAAMVVSNITDYYSAANLGSDLLKEARPLVRAYFEEHGYHFGKLLDIMVKKAEEEKVPAYMDRLLKMAGYEDFMSPKVAAPTTQINITALNKNLKNEYIEDAVEGEVLDEDSV